MKYFFIGKSEHGKAISVDDGALYYCSRVIDGSAPKVIEEGENYPIVDNHDNEYQKKQVTITDNTGIERTGYIFIYSEVGNIESEIKKLSMPEFYYLAGLLEAQKELLGIRASQ